MDGLFVGLRVDDGDGGKDDDDYSGELIHKIIAHDFLFVDLGHPATICLLLLKSSDRFHQC